MLNKTVLIVCGVLGCISLSAQSFSGTGGPIDDSGQQSIFSLNISGLIPPVLNSSFGLETVCINLTHTYDSDLVIWLRSPDGTQVLLSEQNGGAEDDYLNTCFDPFAALPIGAGTPPFTGAFIPQGNLANINNGQNGNGLWQLIIEDVYPTVDAGTLLSWELTFGNNPAAPFEFESSNLPIVVINTLGQIIPDEPKIMVKMGVIDNGPGNRNYISDSFNHYNGWIGIETRGNTSALFDKKPYGFETRDSLGSDIDVSLLGLPEEEDWILNGPYSDKSHLRNVLAMKIAREAGQYASRTAFCELVIDGDYRGLYILMEKIKRDNNRVDIANLTVNDTNGDDLTGGYIFKKDKSSVLGWYSNYDVISAPGVPVRFSYVVPDIDEILPVQETYIQSFVDSFEQAIYSPSFTNSAGIRYDEYVNLRSFAQTFILNELSKNVDAYRLSTYFHKKKDSNGGKIHAGPAWDFNLAFRNANYCAGADPTGWVYYEFCDDGNPFWWDHFLQDSVFVNMLQCEWQRLREDVLQEDSLDNFINTSAIHLEESTERNFMRWPTLGTYVWPNPTPYANTYLEELENMKNFIHDRIAWMDANLSGTCWSVPDLVVQPLVIQEVSCKGGEDGAVSVSASGGNPGYTFLWSNNHTGNEINGLSAGIYTLTVLDNYDQSETMEFEITEPLDSLEVYLGMNNPLDPNCDGTMTTFTQGGTAPYFYQWSLETGNQISETATNLCEGLYCVTVSDEKGCVAQNCGVLVRELVGMSKEIDKEGMMSVWPNPTQDNIHFEWRGDRTPDYELTIYNNMGQRVLGVDKVSEKVHSMGVDELGVGVYHYQIMAGEGMLSGKFVVLK